MMIIRVLALLLCVTSTHSQALFNPFKNFPGQTRDVSGPAHSPHVLTTSELFKDMDETEKMSKHKWSFDEHNPIWKFSMAMPYNPSTVQLVGATSAPNKLESVMQRAIYDEPQSAAMNNQKRSQDQARF